MAPLRLNNVMEWGLFVVTSFTYGFISILAWCWLGRRKLPQGTRLLPMPPTSSIIGHKELRHPNFHREKALEWAKEYGPAYRLRMYLRDVVVLNDFESIKKFSAHDEILHRPDIMNFGLDYNKGVLTLNGKAWQDNRRSCLGILRDLGFAKSTMERTLLREYRHLEEKIEKAAGEPVDLAIQLMECAATNVASFFMPRVQSDSRVRAQLMTILKPVFSFYQHDVLYEFWPPFYEALSRLFPFTSTARADRIIKDLDNFIITEICKHEDVSGKRTFIQEYLNMAAEAGENRSSSYRQRHLVGNIKMFIIGGIDGPSVSMQLCLVIFAARPTEIQRRIQREIDAVIRQGKLPTWDERKRMPFTLACVWELERWKRTEPFGLPRGTGADMVVDNFFVPKGSVVLFNLWKVNRDPSLWKNPHHFDPGRFLQEDGSLVPEKPSYHVGFSFGRRSCPGESFAIMETFLLITFVLQRYNVELGQQLTCDLDDPAINLDELKSFKLRFTRRSKSANQPKVHPNKG